MKILGIIAEYNPFHTGHAYHIKKAKEMIHPNYTVIVMSGAFVQRGEPAIVDKWTRVFYSWATSYFKLYALKKRFFVNFFHF